MREFAEGRVPQSGCTEPEENIAKETTDLDVDCILTSNSCLVWFCGYGWAGLAW